MLALNDRADAVVLWGVELPADALSEAELAYLESLPTEVPENAWVWEEMDRVWHNYGLDNTRPLEGQPVGEFYSHPVWLMNGVFSASDEASSEHRRSIAAYVSTLQPLSVADYGGGFGELAIQIAGICPDSSISIIEPFPSNVGMQRIADCGRIEFIAAAEARAFDVIIAQDVLEHVEDPIGLAAHLSHLATPGGHIVFANNFTPIIQCHLPATFHLFRTFATVMRAMGLSYVGVVPGASHAQVFRVDDRINLQRARTVERMSRSVAPAVDLAASVLPLGSTKRLLNRATQRGRA